MKVNTSQRDFARKQLLLIIRSFARLDPSTHTRTHISIGEVRENEARLAIKSSIANEDRIRWSNAPLLIFATCNDNFPTIDRSAADVVDLIPSGESARSYVTLERQAGKRAGHEALFTELLLGTTPAVGSSHNRELS